MLPRPCATARILDGCGGIESETGRPRDGRRLWDSQAPTGSIRILDRERSRVLGEIRVLPDGAGVLRIDDEYSLLSPQDLEELAWKSELLL